jgi:chromosomal replication initiator protein
MMDAVQAWQSALGQLQMEMPKASFDIWVRDAQVIAFDEGQFTIGVKNAYARDWLESRLASTAARLLMGIMNQKVDVSFVVHTGGRVDGSDGEQEPVAREETGEQAVVRNHRSISLNPRYTFENFVVGSNNRLAHAACQRL